MDNITLINAVLETILKGAFVLLFVFLVLFLIGYLTKVAFFPDKDDDNNG